MPPLIDFEKSKLKGIFAEAGSLIFHKEMLPEFLEFRMMESLRAPLASPGHQDSWATSMAELYSKSVSYRAFIEKVRKETLIGLGSNTGSGALAEYRLRGLSIEASADEILILSAKYLSMNPSDCKWIGFIHFCLSRLIATTAKSSFDSNEWSEASIFSIQLERAFAAGDAKNYGRMVTVDMKKYWDVDALCKLIGDNAGVGLANMVALDPHGDFFHGMNSPVQG